MRRAVLINLMVLLWVSQGLFAQERHEIQGLDGQSLLLETPAIDRLERLSDSENVMIIIDEDDEVPGNEADRVKECNPMCSRQEFCSQALGQCLAIPGEESLN